MPIVAAAVDHPTASVYEIKNSAELEKYVYAGFIALSRSAVIAWGVVTAEGLGPLVRIENHFNADSYWALLDDVLLPYLVGGLFREYDFILQHASSPIQKSKKVAALLESRDVAVLEWPPQSPDLNVIRNVWGNMNIALAHRQLRALSEDALLAIFQEDWERLIDQTPTFVGAYTAPCRAECRLQVVIGAVVETTCY
ncbi:hypothetical protein HPB49_001677 [Dermacentor silvarum]|uniref:Uncharacterized protein n=1 Tax=Dermacentor silvarum TaxID=543639 RepID=A0ACB8CIX3_DERSI|nr:hypothetical protein HPB49_001677 [Dermacentor silvarum]